MSDVHAEPGATGGKIPVAAPDAPPLPVGRMGQSGASGPAIGVIRGQVPSESALIVLNLN